MVAKTFPIEAGHIMMFARSVGDYNNIYYDKAVAARIGFSNVLTPPTFMMAVDHYDENYSRRPQPGEMWFGSGKKSITSDTMVRPVPKGGSGFHAEQRFIYHRHPVAGETLAIIYRDGDIWRKEGRRGGVLTFTEEITEFLDGLGKPVITAVWVSVATEVNVGDGKLSDQDIKKETTTEQEKIIYDNSICAVMKSKIWRVGDSLKKIIVDDLKRTQLVQYSGASGDFHPFHHDEPFAKARGMDGVFAHGMLTMGMSAIIFNDVIDDGALLEYGARFVQPVWPGETLTTTLIIKEIGLNGEQPVVKVHLDTRNNEKQLVLIGDALVKCQAVESKR